MNENPESNVSEKSESRPDADLQQELREQTAQIRCFHVTGIEVENGIATVSLQGKVLDDASIQQLGKILFIVASHADVRGMIMDFNAVDYYSSAAIGKAIATDTILTARGQPGLGMSGMDAAIYEVFRITRLNKRFTIRRDLSSVTEAIEEARQELQQLAAAQAAGVPTQD